MTTAAEPIAVCPRCDGPVYGDREIHECCSRVPEGERCGPCATSAVAEADWNRQSKVCPRCQHRSRFPGKLCRTCTAHDQEEDG